MSRRRRQPAKPRTRHDRRSLRQTATSAETAPLPQEREEKSSVLVTDSDVLARSNPQPERRRTLKNFALALSLLVAACSFEPGGAPLGTEPDAGSDTDADADADTDAAPDAAPDAGTDAAPPSATIVCTTETIDGYPKVVLTFGGDIASGFLGADPGTTPDGIMYGSDTEDLAFSNSCGGNLWAVPYPAGCNKHTAVWGPSPRLYLEPEVDRLNVALHYGGATVRWGDLKTSDGDDVGFAVSGSGTVANGSFDCRIELIDGGTGGVIRTKP